jgi:hypothetical protein
MIKIKRGHLTLSRQCPNEESNGYCYGKFPSAEPSQLELFLLEPDNPELESILLSFDLIGEVELAYLLSWLRSQYDRRQAGRARNRDFYQS